MHRFFTTCRRPLVIAGLLLEIVLTAVGCSRLYSVETLDLADYRPRRVEIDRVPFYPQQAYDCGPATLAMVLNWSGVAVSSASLAPQVLSPERRGTLQAALVAGARRYGRPAYELRGFEALLDELTARNPVIVLQNLGFAWPAQWHYAVAVGFDLSQGIVTLHSGKTARKSVPIRLFLETWKKSEYWGLVVTPPAKIPATASQDTVVAAMIGLERAGQWEAAAIGYRAAIERWTRGVAARIGLANSLYAMGDLPAAEAVLREAACLAPNDGVVYNNLAQVLWEQGNVEQAERFARKAVAIGGPHAATFRMTLNEIQTGKTSVRESP